MPHPRKPDRPSPRPSRPARPHAQRDAAPAPGHATPTAWTAEADWYDQLVGDEGSEFHQHVIHPGVLRLLQVQTGETVLDVGCGQGVLCRLLHARGAQVTGVDLSRPMLEIARQRSDPAIEFIHLDAAALKESPSLRGRFHAAVSVLALQNISELKATLAGMAQCLLPAPTSRLVLVLNHPAFRIPRATSWGWDDGEGKQYRRVDHYLLPRREPIVTHPGKAPGRYTWSFHRPLQDYVKALRQVGLAVDALEEWASHKHSDSGPRAKAENVARKEIPMFMALRAVRVSTPTGGE